MVYENEISQTPQSLLSSSLTTRSVVYLLRFHGRVAHPLVAMQLYMNVEFLLEGFRIKILEVLVAKFARGACLRTHLETSVFPTFLHYQNYRGPKITTIGLFLQILPVLRHFLHSREYVKFAEMNE